MTEIEALKKTQSLWRFLAIHPECIKEDAYRVLGLEKDLYLCPVCEYTKKGNHPDCSICLLKDLWPGNCECMTSDSLYYQWCYTKDLDLRSLFAHRIAAATMYKLEEVYKKEEGDE